MPGPRLSTPLFQLPVSSPSSLHREAGPWHHPLRASGLPTVCVGAAFCPRLTAWTSVCNTSQKPLGLGARGLCPVLAFRALRGGPPPRPALSTWAKSSIMRPLCLPSLNTSPGGPIRTFALAQSPTGMYFLLPGPAGGTDRVAPPPGRLHGCCRKPQKSFPFLKSQGPRPASCTTRHTRARAHTHTYLHI